MKTIDFKLPPTNRWVRFMLTQVGEPPVARMTQHAALPSVALRVAKDGFLSWTGAKVWYLGVGNWRVGGYAYDGSDADAVLSRVLGEMFSDHQKG